jgi:translation initiation factor eIF-2B subunit beta
VSKGFDNKFKCIIDSLRRRELAGSYRVAIATAEVMKVVVSSSRWTSAQTVIERVKEVGKLLISTAPLGSSSLNSVSDCITCEHVWPELCG